MTPKEIANKYVLGNHDALTDNQEKLYMVADIEEYVKQKDDRIKELESQSGNWESAYELSQKRVRELEQEIETESEQLSCDGNCDWQLKGIQSNDYLECSKCEKRKAT